VNQKSDLGSQNDKINGQLRRLPSVDVLLRAVNLQPLFADLGHDFVVDAIRHVLDEWRHRIAAGETLPDDEHIVSDIWRHIGNVTRLSLRPIINGTGVIIHTNLGRAPLSTDALESASDAARGYSNLEFDLESGERGSREVHCEGLITKITNAESAMVVNNNAAAVLLMLSAICRGREVIISRGQLVEIGGGFRIPDVMAQSGARLVEVGTTNRTHLYDYEGAIRDSTAALLVAHHSNFKMIGFTSEPSLGALASLASRHGVPLLYDQGSGAIRETREFGLGHVITVQEALHNGVDIVAFSGDKLLGGPQAGILCGRDELINQMKRHPLARAVRPDKLALAALADTLIHYLTQTETTSIPVWRMIAQRKGTLESRVRSWIDLLEPELAGFTAMPGESAIGGGSLPGTTLPSWLLAVECPDVQRLAAYLRKHEPAIVGRISGGQLLFDARTIDPAQDNLFLSGLSACLRRLLPNEDRIEQR